MPVTFIMGKLWVCCELVVDFSLRHVVLNSHFHDVTWIFTGFLLTWQTILTCLDGPDHCNFPITLPWGLSVGVARIFHVHSVLAQKSYHPFYSYHPLTCHTHVRLSVSTALTPFFMSSWQVHLTKFIPSQVSCLEKNWSPWGCTWATPVVLRNQRQPIPSP